MKSKEKKYNVTYQWQATLRGCCYVTESCGSLIGLYNKLQHDTPNIDYNNYDKIIEEDIKIIHIEEEK